ANTGIGLVTARELARQGAHVFIACRSPERAAAAVEAAKTPDGGPIESLSLDLADLASVRACADAFLARDLPLHLLVNNAGVAGSRGLTKSGFEFAFGVNHIGHFALTRHLLDRLKRSAPARVVTVASRAHRGARGLPPWDRLRARTQSLTGVPEYGVSKLANILFSAALARRLAGTGVTAYSLHPGVVATDVWRTVPWPFRGLMKLGMISAEDGAKTTLYCATSPTAASETGLYYDKCAPVEPTAVARNGALAESLWANSEAAVA
ncbi:MAG TPA: SDR family oxidoreductase, partial [Polyangiaceae bacterium]|nr:SDR family oxidoreductase [Polyangiaceae bacterium]